MKYAAIRAAFELLWLSRLPSLMRALSQSRGVIFTLHRVLPEDPPAFSPNAILQIRPDFLDYVIERVRALGMDIVTLEEAVERLSAKARPRPFIVLTFDDAYRDNLEYALPILRRHEAPFMLYVPTAMVDGVGELWWQAIEDVIARQDAVSFTENGEVEYVDTATASQKQQAYNRFYWHLRRLPEPQRRALLGEFCANYGFDLEAQCRALIMSWQELRHFVDEPLCTIGAHTVHHYELAKLSSEAARQEMAQSVEVIEAQFGIRPEHFAYPLGGPLSCGPREYDLARELGFKTAVTTRPGGLYPHHLGSLMQLPRVSLNGLFQSKRYVDVFATGSLFTTIGKFAG